MQLGLSPSNNIGARLACFWAPAQTGRQARGRQPDYEVNSKACLTGRAHFWVCFSIVSHVRAAEMKLRQNNLLDLRLKFCFSFISILFQFHFTCAPCFSPHFNLTCDRFSTAIVSPLALILVCKIFSPSTRPIRRRRKLLNSRALHATLQCSVDQARLRAAWRSATELNWSATGASSFENSDRGPSINDDRCMQLPVGVRWLDPHSRVEAVAS